MPPTATFNVYGVRLRVEAFDPGALAAASAVLPVGAQRVQEQGEVARSYVLSPLGEREAAIGLWLNGRLVTRGRSVEDILVYLRLDARAFVVRSSRESLFVHAGAVGWKGQGVVLPGLSRAGKSTLVMALVRAGASYYSDDYARLDTAGRLSPYLCAVRERTPTGINEVAPEVLGGPIGDASLPVGLVVLLNYEPKSGLKIWNCRVSSAILSCLQHTPASTVAPRFTLRTLRAALREGRCFVGTRGDAEEAAVAILRLAESPLGLPASDSRTHER